MVFDYMDHDLTGLMDRLGHNLPVTEVRMPSHPCAQCDHLDFLRLPGGRLEREFKKWQQSCIDH